LSNVHITTPYQSMAICQITKQPINNLIIRWSYSYKCKLSNSLQSTS